MTIDHGKHKRLPSSRELVFFKVEIDIFKFQKTKKMLEVDNLMIYSRVKSDSKICCITGYTQKNQANFSTF